MGRNRTDAAMLRLSGAWRADRHTDRADHAQAGPPLDPNAPPPDLTPRQCAIWRRIIATAPPGLLRQADEALIATLAPVLDVRQEAAREVALTGTTGTGSTGQAVQSVHLKTLLDASRLAAALLTQAGLTPTSRLRVLSAEGAEEGAKAWDADDQWATFERPTAIQQADAKAARKARGASARKAN